MAADQPVPATPAASVPAEAWLLDVREPDEWSAGHAPAAVHISMGELNERAGEIPRDEPVYVICRSGNRSARAVQALNAAGWEATNVSGGMNEWAAAGRPMVSESGDDPFVM